MITCSLSLTMGSSDGAEDSIGDVQKEGTNWISEVVATQTALCDSKWSILLKVFWHLSQILLTCEEWYLRCFFRQHWNSNVLGHNGHYRKRSWFCYKFGYVFDIWLMFDVFRTFSTDIFSIFNSIYFCWFLVRTFFLMLRKLHSPVESYPASKVFAWKLVLPI